MNCVFGSFLVLFFCVSSPAGHLALRERRCDGSKTPFKIFSSSSFFPSFSEFERAGRLVVRGEMCFCARFRGYLIPNKHKTYLIRKKKAKIVFHPKNRPWLFFFIWHPQQTRRQRKQTLPNKIIFKQIFNYSFKNSLFEDFYLVGSCI